MSAILSTGRRVYQTNLQMVILVPNGAGASTGTVIFIQLS